MKVIGTGNSVCNFTIACGWKTKEKEGTEWVNVVAWGKLAEICGQYLHKGSKVFISGNMRTRKWQGQDGKDRYTTEIVANNMQMLDSKGSGSGADANPHRAPSKQQSAPDPMPDNDFDDSDIPW